jgi:hypothetical protein
MMPPWLGGLVVASAVVISAQTSQILPVDEAASHPDFFSFRAQLQRAIARHDTDAVMAVVDPDIKVSFGPGNGRDVFRRLWGLGAADAESALWSELGAVLALGGEFQTPDTFVAPYTFSRWPASIDAFEHVALVGADVRLRSEPRPDATVLTSLSFAILPVARTGSVLPDGWTAVDAGAGRVGYIASPLVRSPIDYRAHFALRGGQWRLVMFLAGD